MATAKKPEKTAEPMVTIYLPLRDREGNSGMEVDQTETVGINGVMYVIKRGEQVEVPVPVFEALYHSGRFPGL